MSTGLIIGVLIIWLVYKIFSRVMDLIEYKIKNKVNYDKSMYEIDNYITKVDEDFGDI